MAYDIIGDIHGHADKLEALLKRLGYSVSGGRYRHPERTVLFVGDFIDRGPDQLRTVDIARRMVDGGSAMAVMGNHELNAIAWHTPHPKKDGEFLRPHHHPVSGTKNRKQHEQFLREVEHDAALHKDIVDWFLTLPLWLELDGVRVVHACWHATFMAWLSPRLREGRFLTPELMLHATEEPANPEEKDSPTPSVFKAVEAITKGIEIPLPDGHFFQDKDGHTRHHVRVRWWDHASHTYRTAAMLPHSDRENFPDEAIPDHARIEPPTDKPIFFGHYWMTKAPVLQSPSAVCVDYSAGFGGSLVAYRWSGESDLDRARFVSSD